MKSAAETQISSVNTTNPNKSHLGRDFKGTMKGVSNEAEPEEGQEPG